MSTSTSASRSSKEIKIQHTGTAYDAHDFAEFDSVFYDVEALARYMLLPENDSEGFVAFRNFIAEDDLPYEEWRLLACEMAQDADVPVINLLVFGIQVVWAVADHLRFS